MDFLQKFIDHIKLSQTKDATFYNYFLNISVQPSCSKKNGNIFMLRHSASCWVPIPILVDTLWTFSRGKCPPEVVIFHRKQKAWECPQIRGLLVV